MDSMANRGRFGKRVRGEVKHFTLSDIAATAGVSKHALVKAQVRKALNIKDLASVVAWINAHLGVFTPWKKD